MNTQKLLFTISIAFLSIKISAQTCPLSADATLSTTSYIAPDVTFVNLTTGTTSSTTYTWDFGDGNTSNLASPTHTYTGNGSYSWTLTASDSPTCIAIKTSSGWDNAVICTFTPSMTYTLLPGGLTHFGIAGVGSGSNCYLGPLSWWFGDYVNSISFFNPAPSHVFYNGTYISNVALYYGSCYNWTLVSSPITVTDNPCFANAAYTYTLGNSGSVQFSVTMPSSNPNMVYEWDFADGFTSSQLNPFHTFPSAGTYTVLLTSRDTTYGGYGCVDKDTTAITITGIPCVANPGFSIFPLATPHNYYLVPSFPYNFAKLAWDWGDSSPLDTVLITNHTYSAAGTYDICLTVTATCGSTATACSSQYMAKGTGDMIYVSVQIPEKITGIEEIESTMTAVDIFPNPTEGMLNIKVNCGACIREVRVHDLLGQIVYIESSPKTGNLTAVDLRNLNNGVYFLQIKLPQKVISSKIVISR